MATENSYEVLKLIIAHENLGFIEPSFIKIEEILDWLEEKAGYRVSKMYCRAAIASLLNHYTEMMLPVYDNAQCKGRQATLVLKESFLSKCLIIVQDA